MESALNIVRLKNNFQNALNRGRRQSFWHKLRGRRPHLLSLEEVLANKPVTRLPAGLEQVALTKVRGSVGRAKDYSPAFLPLRPSDESRWVRIAQALEGPGLPPVHLLHYRGVYFVDDGHHRVSVLRYFDVESVNADVTHLSDIRLTSPSPLTANDSRSFEMGAQ